MLKAEEERVASGGEIKIGAFESRYQSSLCEVEEMYTQSVSAISTKT